MDISIVLKKILLPFLLINLLGCGNNTSVATTDTAYASVDTTVQAEISTTNESVIDVRHKYSYVSLNEDGSKVAGLLELYGTNDYTQAATINGFTQSGRGTFTINGDKLILNRTSGIAINGELTIVKEEQTGNLHLILSNGVNYVQDDNSSYLKSMTVTPKISLGNENSNIDQTQNAIPKELIFEGTMHDDQTGISQDYTLFIKPDFSSASIGGGPYNKIEDQGDGTYMWLDGTIIGMSFRPTSNNCILYGSDGNYFCTLYKKE